MEFTQEIFDRINSFDTIKAGITAIAAETGLTEKSISNYYYQYKRYNNIDYSFRENKSSKRIQDIIQEVSKNPDNLRKAFIIVAKKYNTTWKAVSNHYYKVIKNNPDYPIFTLMSKKSGSMNVKNNINNKYSRHKTNHSFIEQTWGKIKFFINNILK